MPAEIYVGATKARLEEKLNQALREVRQQPEGSVSFTIYADTNDNSVTFSDEDTSDYPEGQIEIEVT